MTFRDRLGAGSVGPIRRAAIADRETLPADRGTEELIEIRVLIGTVQSAERIPVANRASQVVNRTHSIGNSKPEGNDDAERRYDNMVRPGCYV